MPGSQICRAAICLWLWKSCGCNFHIPWGWSCNNCVEMKIPYTNFGYFIWAEQKRFASWADLKFPRTPTEQREVKKWVDWLQSWAAGQWLRTSLALAHSFIRWWEMSPLQPGKAQLLPFNSLCSAGPTQTPCPNTCCLHKPHLPILFDIYPTKSLTKMQGAGTTPSPPAWISNYVLYIGYGVLMTMHEFLSFQPKGPFSMQQMAAHRHLKPREHSATGRLWWLRGQCQEFGSWSRLLVQPPHPLHQLNIIWLQSKPGEECIHFN